MKKTILSLIMLGAAAFSARAALVLNEPFTYDDGPLTTVSSGLWVKHSGTTAEQVDVLSGKVRLEQAQSEDVNAPLSGSPYSTGNLYASFVVNFSTVPTGSGAYFAHFKGAGGGDLRARLFAVGTGAETGKFRVGISTASTTPTIIATDLSPNTDYILVMRYDCGTAVSTLWINPGSESATADKAESTDVQSAIAMTSFALRQGSSSQGDATIDNLKVGTAFADVAGGDSTANPPVISNIGDQSIPANGSTGAIGFTVNDGETAAGSLVLSKSSSNTDLIPDANIVFGGSGTDRTVTVTPLAGQQGSSTITVTVTDGNNNTASREFVVVVGAPSISSVGNQTTPTNSVSAPIPFTVSDNESDPSTLTVFGSSSNEALVPSANIVIGGSGANRTAVITPAADQVGIATITLIVSDGINSSLTSFIITVYPVLGLDIQDQFNYPDGSLVSGSGFIWNRHSGTTNQTQVSGGQVLLSETQSEDFHTFLTRSPYDTNSGAILYSSFTANFSALPASAGYFAHFRDTGSGFRARVFATITNAAPGSFRLGISNSGNTFDELPTDLSLNTTYTVITRYNVGTGESTLWVNPTSEASPSVSGTDNPFTGWIWTYAFRQAPGIGALAIDNLKVGTAFSEVYDASAVPPTMNVSITGSTITLSWTTADSAYVLQSVSTLGGSWGTASETPVQDGNNYTVTINGASGNQFYRLAKP